MRDADVVCFYADIGNPVYRPLLKRMADSAHRVMPDCRVVLLTPNNDSTLMEGFDLGVHLKCEVTADNLCGTRALSTVTWALQTDRTALYVDPDIDFRNVPELEPYPDILLSWRKRPDQPVNTGIVIAKPGHHEFWKHYGAVAASLPRPLQSWWCDQLAFNLMVGVDHEAGDYIECADAIVRLIDSRLMCAKPEESTEETWTLHYKGAKRKARSLEKSGDGNSLAACA